ncbi:MAG TPA: DUF5683 domain-containing protein [Cyclobacteriaceae bacterium]|nr:DUF5683 domain-containing protein [Cyclobacteriaceae bacterium]
MKDRFYLIVVLILFTYKVSAQEEKKDSIDVIKPSITELDESDTVRIQSYAKRFNPAKASLYAAVLPGLGQIYNKKYWKLPLVYGGFFATGYAINVYQSQYKDYKEQLFYILETGEEFSKEGYTEDQLRPAIDKARRERDFFIIIMAGVYILQILDAHIDAHLKEFDVNPNLQVKFEPMLENDMLLGRQAGFSVILKF